MTQHKVAATLSKLFGRYASAVRSGLTVSLFSFLGIFGTALVGWVTQVTDWASKHGADPFPSTSVLGYAFVSALTAIGPGVVATLVRGFQTAFNIGNVPIYQGQTSPTPTVAVVPVNPNAPQRIDVPLPGPLDGGA